MFSRIHSLIFVVLLTVPAACQDPISFLDYDPVTGSLGISGADDSSAFTTIEIVSPAGVFTRTSPAKNSIFDVYYDYKFFTLVNSGLPSGTDLGPIVADGLDPAELAANICVNGSFLGGGTIQPVAIRNDDSTWAVAEACPTVPGRPHFIEPIDFYLDYSSADGHLSIDSTGQPLSLIRLQGIGNERIFGDVRPAFLTEPTDSYSFSQLTMTSINGFETFDLGTVLSNEIVAESPTVEQLASSLCYRATTTELRKSGQLYIRSEGSQTHAVSACGDRITIPQEAFDFLLDPTVDVGIVVDSEDNVIVHVPIQEDSAVAPLVELEIKATEDIFVPAAANSSIFSGPFDLINRNQIQLSNSNGLSTTLNLGPILHPDVDVNELDQLLSIEGTFLGGAAVEKTAFVVVPEPGGPSIAVAGLLTVLGMCRRR